LAQFLEILFPSEKRKRPESRLSGHHGDHKIS
jgi:hypothetical protein